MKNNSNESRIFELVGKIVIKEAEKKMAKDYNGSVVKTKI